MCQTYWAYVFLIGCNKNRWTISPGVKSAPRDFGPRATPHIDYVVVVVVVLVVVATTTTSTTTVTTTTPLENDLARAHGTPVE